LEKLNQKKNPLSLIDELDFGDDLRLGKNNSLSLSDELDFGDDLIIMDESPRKPEKNEKPDNPASSIFDDLDFGDDLTPPKSDTNPKNQTSILSDELDFGDDFMTTENPNLNSKKNSDLNAEKPEEDQKRKMTNDLSSLSHLFEDDSDDLFSAISKSISSDTTRKSDHCEELASPTTPKLPNQTKSSLFSDDFDFGDDDNFFGSDSKMNHTGDDLGCGVKENGLSPKKTKEDIFSEDDFFFRFCRVID